MTGLRCCDFTPLDPLWGFDDAGGSSDWFMQGLGVHRSYSAGCDDSYLWDSTA